MGGNWLIGAGTLLGVGLGIVTVTLTHRAEWKVVPGDTRPLELAAEGLQSELDRLHSRYVDQLDALADEVKVSRGNTFGPELTAEKIVGVRTITILSLNEGEAPIHVEIRKQGEGELAFEAERFPVPALYKNEANTELRLFGPERFSEVPGSVGWLREAGDVFYFWKRIQPSAIVMVGIDGISIRLAISRWLSEKSDLAIHQLQSGLGELIQVIEPEGGALVQSGESNSGERYSDPVIFPATIRFGTWQIQAWNAEEITNRWNIPYLIGGLTISLLLVASSIIAAMEIRRATRLAERRVSFVNSASHELRSPITNMMLNVDLAQDLADEDPEAARSRLDRVKEEAGRLSRLVDNLLTFSRVGKGIERLHLEPIDPDSVLDSTLETFAAAMDRCGIRVTREKGETVSVKADSDALSRIFGNLISNVEKYATNGKLLKIETVSKGKVWVADFIDHGPGIPAKFARRIFEPFRRGSDRINEGVSGTGLGLTISRDLARRQGGDLVLVSSSEGAVFRLTLPVTEL